MHYSSRRNRRSRLLAGTAILGLTVMLGAAHAQAGSDFDISAQPLPKALAQFGAQSGFEIIADSMLTASKRSVGVSGNVDPDVALSRILRGTGLTYRRDDGSYVIIAATVTPRQVAQATPARATAAAGIESVVVTSSKIKGDIQTVPIAITALSQEQLTSRQIAGGPDLVKEVPNLTFTKTNFTGYSIQIRGIGTQAISVTTDPAVAVALNDTPFIRNHFFEQEFYDVGQLEVLRGPQGTLYGRNATAGVVNIVSAKPTDQFEAMLSADWGNYVNRRYEGMVNIPIVDDRVDLRIAGEWTKRDGYTTNSVTGSQVDGRDLWSSRVTLGWKPLPSVQAYVVWEHFQESDDRMRTAKQLCHRDPGASSVLGVPVTDPQTVGNFEYLAFTVTRGTLGQGCLPASMYSPDSFEVPYGYSLPIVEAGYTATPVSYSGGMNATVDPYSGTTQSRNLREIATQINPRYFAKNDTLELNVDYDLSPALTFTSQTGFNEDFLWSTEDYNRFNTSPDIFDVMQCNGSPACQNEVSVPSLIVPDGNYRCHEGTLSIGGPQDCTNPGNAKPTGYFCDPQLGCSSRLVAQDISNEHAWQLSQEFRFASNFKGPFNFSVGGNYMHYETVEDYYVLSNTFTLLAASIGTKPDTAWMAGVSDNSACLGPNVDWLQANPGYQYFALGAQNPGLANNCYYIDPNPLTSLNGLGHSYFRSQNPYVLNSYAGFGEAYYDVAPDLKLTGGIRWTDDEKHFTDIPSELLVTGIGYATFGTVDQKWNQLTGRLAANWTPKLDFTDQTLVYGSFAHGYKAGGANPPGAILVEYAVVSGPNGESASGIPTHPFTFKPEFVDAYELGTKNTLADGGLTLNGDVFFYNYSGYQISEIVDRTSINLNFDATVKGAELEASYEPLPGLKFNFAGGYEDTRIKDGQSAIDLIDRTDSANHPGWMVMKPFVTEASNCVFPDYVVAGLLTNPGFGGVGNQAVSACSYAYIGHRDPVTLAFYHYDNGSPYYVFPDPSTGLEPSNGVHHNYPYAISNFPGGLYPGYDPVSPDAKNTFNGVDYGPAPNNGAGFAKPLGGHQLPNAPHFTVSFSAEYTMPVSEEWAASLHSDFYWQSQSFARVFNDRPFDKIRGYSNVNLALILTSASGWQVMGYLKNVFDTTAITGTFLNSDDSGLTTNVFLTDPRLYGVRVTKNF